MFLNPHIAWYQTSNSVSLVRATKPPLMAIVARTLTAIMAA